MDDPNRPMNAVERMERETAEAIAAHRKPLAWHGLRPGTIVKCPNFQRDDGTYLNPVQARNYLYDCLAEGKEKLPMGPCDNFDYSSNGGCRGHEVPEDAEECAEAAHAQD